MVAPRTAVIFASGGKVVMGKPLPHGTEAEVQFTVGAGAGTQCSAHFESPYVSAIGAQNVLRWPCWYIGRL
jgi:hypothetical protein